MTFYRHSSRERFENPLPRASRIAILAPNFLERQGVRCFEAEDLAAVEAFAPEILAGTVEALLRAAARVRVSRALVVFSGARVGTVSRKERELLWTAFQVPIFEQTFGSDGTVVARECEAHDGLHLVSMQAAPGPLRTDPCPCGRAEPRISA